MMKVILFLMLATVAHGVVFECHFVYSNWYILNTHYACAVTIQHSGNNGVLDNVIGTHYPEMNNSDVVGLQIYGNGNFTGIPVNIEQYFPNLLGIDFNIVDLPHLSADDLKPFSKLKYINFDTNKLLSIDSDLFKYTPNLKFIRFVRNPLEHVGKNLLTGLSLTYTYFRSNTCIDYEANNKQEYGILINKLVTQCPPLTCSVECVNTAKFYSDVLAQLDKIRNNVMSKKCPKYL